MPDGSVWQSFSPVVRSNEKGREKREGEREEGEKRREGRRTRGKEKDKREGEGDKGDKRGERRDGKDLRFLGKTKQEKNLISSRRNIEALFASALRSAIAALKEALAIQLDAVGAAAITLCWLSPMI